MCWKRRPGKNCGLSCIGVGFQWHCKLLQEPHGEEGGISGDNWNCKRGLQCNFKHLARKNGVRVSYVHDILNVGTFANEFCTLTLICFSTINTLRHSRLKINAVLFERFTAPSFLNTTIPLRTVVCQLVVLKDAVKWYPGFQRFLALGGLEARRNRPQSPTPVISAPTLGERETSGTQGSEMAAVRN